MALVRPAAMWHGHGMPDQASLSRRQVLRAGAGVAGLAFGGLVVGGQSQNAGAFAAATPADWADLGRSIRGTLIMPNDPAYATARLGWNTIYDGIAPQAVLQPAGVGDVQQAIAFCRDTGVRPTPRSGGHSFQGFSTSTGLIIDMSAMKSVTMNSQRSRARIGAGAVLIDVYAKLFQQGKMAIPGGTCPMVGISGLTQGGGVGPFIREYGLTLDRLVGAHIVTADGQHRYVNASEDRDIFWAIRGGGGGNFGVVTAFDFVPVPADMPTISANMTFAWRHAERVLEAFQTWPDALPASAHPNLVLATSDRSANAQPTATVGLWYRGSRARADQAMREFIAEVGVAPTSQTVLKQTFFEAEYDEYCAGFTEGQCTPVTSPGGLLPRLGLSTYSEISSAPWPRAANDVIVEELERWQRDRLLQPEGVSSALQAGKVIIEPLSGAVHDTAPTATAFPYRDGWLVYQFQSRVRPGAPAETVAAGQSWVNRFMSRLTPWRTGAEYSNYGNRELDQWATAYYGVNLPRLRKVKAAVDPGGLFRFEQSVRPDART
ncbi:unannotated protein [freshwater metagenome]|uniref:Unannotated protein n=1 Tax=freshwater metagenome TaxID=449393 RepID=A0A6J7HZE5_9ZZZZ